MHTMVGMMVNAFNALEIPITQEAEVGGAP